MHACIHEDRERAVTVLTPVIPSMAADQTDQRQQKVTCAEGFFLREQNRDMTLRVAE